MKSDPIHQPNERKPENEQNGLTEAQQAFAKVVGRALAEAWRHEGQKAIEKPRFPSRQDTRQPSRESH